MRYAGHLGAGRQQLVQMTTPACRVFFGPVAACLRPSENQFDAAADTTGCFRLGFPNRLKRLHHQPGIDRSDRKVAEDGIDKGGKSGGPPPVRGIAPAGRVRGNVALGTVLEGDRLGGSKALRLPLRSARISRVDPIEKQCAGSERLGSCVSEGDELHGAKPHLTLASVAANIEEASFSCHWA